MANYSLTGQKWGSSAFGTSGGIVTWAVNGTVPQSFVSVFSAAFAAWSAVGNIVFQQVASVSDSLIDIVFGTIDGPNGTLGVASYSYSGSAFLAATVTFDSAEGWQSSGDSVVSNSGARLLIVAEHEFGHAIGLDHYDAVPAVMNTVISPSITGLTQSDIEGARALYGPAPQMVAPQSPGPYTITHSASPHDFDGNGRGDVLWQNTNGQVTLWLSTASGFSGRNVAQGDATWDIQGGGDFSGDGKTDILWKNTDGSIAVWTSQGSTFSGENIASVGTSWHVRGTSDFDGDGKDDVLWQNDSGLVHIWTSQGSGFSGRDIGTIGAEWRVKEAADFNGDGRSDLIWQNLNGTVELWASSGAGFAGQGLGTVGADWHLVGAGDVNGDGRSDIIWQNDDGTIHVWRAGSIGFSGQDVAHADRSWHLVETSDVNGDTRADIIWRNDDGRIAVWTSDGVAFAGSDYGALDTSWQIYG